MWLNTQTSQAELVTFDLGLNGPSSANGADLLGFSSASTSVSGSNFTVTLTAKTFDPTSVFRMNRNGLGINSAGRDRSGQIDDRDGPSEGVQFFFSVTSPTPTLVTFVDLDLNAISGSGQAGHDQAELAFEDGPTFSIDGTNATGSADLFSVNTSFSLSKLISLRHVDGNGFRLNAITLEVLSTPESSSVLMLASALFLVSIRRKRFVDERK